jgi:hypothetical protein
VNVEFEASLVEIRSVPRSTFWAFLTDGPQKTQLWCARTCLTICSRVGDKVVFMISPDL